MFKTLQAMPRTSPTVDEVMRTIRDNLKYRTRPEPPSARHLEMNDAKGASSDRGSDKGSIELSATAATSETYVENPFHGLGVRNGQVLSTGVSADNFPTDLRLGLEFPTLARTSDASMTFGDGSINSLFDLNFAINTSTLNGFPALGPN